MTDTPDLIAEAITEAAHTPGPWEFTQCDHAPVLHIYAPDNKHVFHGDRSLPEQEANAYVMAAAPDMLAALKFTEGYIEGQQASEIAERGCADTHWETLLDEVRAAILKAEGRTTPVSSRRQG